MRYIEVILPISIPGLFSYSVPTNFKQKNLKGCRVIVPFGKRKYYTGLVYKNVDKVSSKFAVKEVFEVLDVEPIVTTEQLKFIDWVSNYYMCNLGDAYNAALPAGLKLTSESYLGMIPDIDINFEKLSDNEKIVIYHLKRNNISVEEVKKITRLKYPFQLVKNLIDAGIIYTFEKIKDKYTPKKEIRVKLHSHYIIEESFKKLSKKLNKYPRQAQVLQTYLKKIPVFENITLNELGISKKSFQLSGINASSLNTLIKNGIFETWEQQIDRFSFDHVPLQALPKLTIHQHHTLIEIQKSFTQKSTTLLWGVTGSGKTEIYITLVHQIIKNGGQILILLPEIALTTQIIQRFRCYFGNRFGVYHSRFSDNERTEIYQNCLNDKYDFLIGVRSTIFLPFKHLELIIVDEEHEYSYKQYDPAPRYHARDSALYLAQIHHAKVLLGSATPSLESYQNAIKSKFGFVKLNQRFKYQPLPEIKLANLSIARKQKKMKGHFTVELIDQIKSSINKNKQVILFQNRRGYAPIVECSECNHIPNCPNCAVSLTYHIYQNEVICHYCGFKIIFTKKCEKCHSNKIKTIGLGTEQIEEELSILIPSIRIKRMDLDTTRSRHAYQKIIDAFENRKIDVLVGTQMVTKGLDFEHVNLVGIFDADRIIHFPDFRSHERAFQLITQVSGRSGRKHDRGQVIIQTNKPEHPLLLQIKEGHLDLFYNQELAERKKFKYPPFYRLIKIIIKGKNKNSANQAANKLNGILQETLSEKRILGPAEPMINKIRNYYLFEIIIKIEKETTNLKSIKKFIQGSRHTLLALPKFKSLLIHFDVDPI
mgnify:CR=1 FL=1